LGKKTRKKKKKPGTSRKERGHIRTGQLAWWRFRSGGHPRKKGVSARERTGKSVVGSKGGGGKDMEEEPRKKKTESPGKTGEGGQGKRKSVALVGSTKWASGENLPKRGL